MPNFVANCVIPKKIDAFKEFVKGDTDFMDFNKLIPMPDSLNITSPTRWEDNSRWRTVSEFQKQFTPILQRVLLFSPSAEEFYDNSKEIIDKLKMTDEVKAHYNVGTRTDVDDYKELFYAYFNLQKYGHTDWYDWRVENWGTKWNASDSRWCGDELWFDTAWSSPLPIYELLAKQFDFVAFYSDEDMGSNLGVIVAKDGEISIDTFHEQSFNVRYALANLFHGEDCTFEFERDNDYDYPSDEEVAKARAIYNKYYTILD